MKPAAPMFVLKLPAEPGWHALTLERGDDGKIRSVEGGHHAVFEAVHWWGMVAPDTGNASTMADFLGLGGQNPWHPLGADGQSLHGHVVSYHPPGVTLRDAVDALNAKAASRQLDGSKT